MVWDMFDMGEKHTSLSGNRYISVFLIHHSRFAITILHKDHSFDTIKSLLISAFARTGFTPKKVQHDGAGEYVSKDLEKWLEEQGAFIFTELSNQHEQFQEGLAPEFWGAATLTSITTYHTAALINSIFVSRNVTFNETLFPMREHDQRVYGIYDNQALQEMCTDAYGTTKPMSIN
eukprot:1266233-Rhodomonas_salina.2